MDNNTKKVLEKLLKIASNQQKIINKLATENLPAHLAPGGSTHTPSKVLYDNLPADLKQIVQHTEVHGNRVTVTYKPGMGDPSTDKRIQDVFK